MPRVKSLASGAIMTVSDATADRLGGEWVDADSVARSEAPDATWKVADLKAFAEENGIDLGDAKKKEDLMGAIAASTTSASDDNPNE